MAPLSSGPASAGTGVILACVGAPAVYHACLTIARTHQVWTRRRRLERKQRDYATRKLIEQSAKLKAGDTAVVPGDTQPQTDVTAGVGEAEATFGARDALHASKSPDKADEEECEMLREAFASWRCLGRWHNALGYEWREQGVWEWAFWKLIWAPLHGKIWYGGGAPSDPAELAKTLPVMAPNFIQLFGFDPSRPDAPATPDAISSLTASVSALDASPPRSASSQEMSDSWEKLSSTSQPSEELVPARSSTASKRGNSPAKESQVPSDLTFCWIGQSTTYVQLDGVGILTDPVFAHKTVDTWLAPPRLAPPPCQLRDLMTCLQICIVSHDHFDHVHPDDVREIGDSVQWVVPLGLGSFLRACGITRIIELDWWQTATVVVNLPQRSEPVSIKISATPAQHWAARSPFATNSALWASFVVQGSRQSFFHAGDTGYTDGAFKAIGRVFGGVDLALLPIGAYEPRWHLSPQHASPSDAIKIARDIKARKSVGVHHGTWVLSDEHYLQPPLDLDKAKAEVGMTDDEFVTVRPGQVMVLSPKT
ncbi:hypothetical protein OIV83_003735 [Microbotryomycetes sp. JL201]|nr:hypothetical protein OIV83_003735 [Microbotryomycetes sp. JL201]